MTRLRMLLGAGLAAVAVMAAAGVAAPARAGNIELSVDSSLADYVLETACSGAAVDEERLRNSKTLQAQIKHHSAFNEKYSMDSFIDGLKAASQCKTLEGDPYRFRYVVEQKDMMAKAITFLKAHEKELADFVIENTAPYFPADKSFGGDIVLAAASFSCGGFSMEGSFFIDVPCVAATVEDEFEAIKVLSAHETYHALQYAFFAPFNEDFEPVDTPGEAQAYLFMSLLAEGSAEYVADSRGVPGEGSLAKIFRDFSQKGYRRLDYNLRLLGYVVEALGRKGDSNQRIRDIYALGFGGDRGQEFYYVGAAMAGEIEKAFGREQLICIMALSPEQFVLAYEAAVLRDGAEAPPIGDGAVRAAVKLGRRHAPYNTCLP